MTETKFELVCDFMFLKVWEKNFLGHLLLWQRLQCLENRLMTCSVLFHCLISGKMQIGPNLNWLASAY